MNSIEALKLLGLEQGATEEEIKSAFRKTAGKLHPDVNKAEDAEAKFKQANEAYQLLTSPQPTPFSSVNYASAANAGQEEFMRGVQDMFNVFFRPASSYRPGKQGSPFGFQHPGVYVEQTFSSSSNNYNQRSSIIEKDLSISFKTSILGGKKEISYQGSSACAKCSGLGQTFEEDGQCNKCEGKGRRTYPGAKEKETAEKELPCNTCKGSGKQFKQKLCPACSGSCYATKDKKATVNVPAGIRNGHVATYTSNGDTLKIKYLVEPIEGIFRSDKNKIDIVSVLKVTLLEALKGATKEVETIHGKKSLKIPGPRKNGDEITAAKLGVPPNGNHIFVLDVEYPEDIEPLIRALEDDKSLDIDIVVEEEGEKDVQS